MLGVAIGRLQRDGPVAERPPSCTIVPLSRGSMLLRVVRVPYAYPRYVTSVTRLNSPGSISVNGAITEVNATLTLTSTGEGRRGRHCGGFGLCAVDDVSG